MFLYYRRLKQLILLPLSKDQQVYKITTSITRQIMYVFLHPLKTYSPYNESVNISALSPLHWKVTSRQERVIIVFMQYLSKKIWQNRISHNNNSINFNPSWQWLRNDDELVDHPNPATVRLTIWYASVDPFFFFFFLKIVCAFVNLSRASLIN